MTDFLFVESFSFSQHSGFCQIVTCQKIANATPPLAKPVSFSRQESKEIAKSEKGFCCVLGEYLCEIYQGVKKNSADGAWLVVGAVRCSVTHGPI